MRTKKLFTRNTRIQKSIETDDFLAFGITMGLAIGMGIGITFGAALGNLALGMTFGPSLGIAIGAAIALSLKKTPLESEVTNIPTKKR